MSRSLDGAGFGNPLRLVERSTCIFERHPRLYAFWREHLFRDDTERICRDLWPDASPPPGSVVLELGCGPAFYARRLAARFPSVRVVGLDRSEAQVHLALQGVARQGLPNCSVMVGDACALPLATASVDAVVVSRLLTVIGDREATITEVHRVLRPGGRVFLAEPRSSFRARLPLAAMRLADGLSGAARRAGAFAAGGESVQVMNAQAFSTLTDRQPWASVRRTADRWYQYAVCERAR